MSIDEIINYCINNKVSLRVASLRDGYSPSYYSNVVNKNYPHLKSKIKNIKSNIFNLNADKIYPRIVMLINDGFSTTDIAKKLKKSNPYIIKVVRYKDEKDILLKLKRNNNWNKWKGLRATLGHAKGKTYEMIYGDRAEHMKKQRSVWLKQNNIRKFATKVSKPQALLYGIVKSVFKNAELEYQVMVTDTKSIWLDIAVPDKKINIEYDGVYWHTHNAGSIPMSDKNRDEFLKSQGWKVYRIQSDKNLTEEEFKIEFYKLHLL